jgi:anaerobic ribonucleoside-triphosphate reductase activating protein
LALPLPLAGLTLSGGEPFDQAKALAILLGRVLPERPGWDVIAYSGYTLATLRQGGDAALLEKVDVLVDGPYRADIPQRHPLAGSGNQQVHGLTARGRAMLPTCAALPMENAELGLGPAGEGLLIGVISSHRRKMLREGLELVRPVAPVVEETETAPVVKRQWGAPEESPHGPVDREQP